MLPAEAATQRSYVGHQRDHTSDALGISHSLAGLPHPPFGGPWATTLEGQKVTSSVAPPAVGSAAISQGPVIILLFIIQELCRALFKCCTHLTAQEAQITIPVLQRGKLRWGSD